jgi:hypothetical protein
MNSLNDATASATPTGRKSARRRNAAQAPLPQVQDVIGERLRAVYSEILRDPIPERFVELLQRLDGRTEDRA